MGFIFPELGLFVSLYINKNSIQILRYPILIRRSLSGLIPTVNNLSSKNPKIHDKIQNPGGIIMGKKNALKPC
ncbi:MAG: hypothetical protein FWB99_04740, partial [Treponema sp.]|nr:hypothetical protein [Treponema sp.]